MARRSAKDRASSIAADVATLDNMLVFARGWTRRARQATRRGRTTAALNMLRRMDLWLLDAVRLYRRIAKRDRTTS
jgi:hypothetical protein